MLNNSSCAELSKLCVGNKNNGLSVMIAPNGENCLQMLFFLQSGHVRIMFGIQSGAACFCNFYFFLSKCFILKYSWGWSLIYAPVVYDVLLGVHVLQQRRWFRRTWRIFSEWEEVWVKRLSFLFQHKFYMQWLAQRIASKINDKEVSLIEMLLINSSFCELAA